MKFSKCIYKGCDSCHSRGGRSAEINVRFAPPTMCRLTVNDSVVFSQYEKTACRYHLFKTDEIAVRMAKSMNSLKKMHYMLIPHSPVLPGSEFSILSTFPLTPLQYKPHEFYGYIPYTPHQLFAFPDNFSVSSADHKHTLSTPHNHPVL